MMESEQFYWDARYRSGYTSGYGSYGEMLESKLEEIKKLEDVHSITEIGCGDFHFGQKLVQHFKAPYAGFDISQVIIERNKNIYPMARFGLMDEEMPKADLVLCVDVLFHILKEEDVEKMLVLLENIWTKYLVITAYERDEKMENHVRIRNFDYKRFGEPIVRKVIEEDGQLYFYIFKK